MKIFYVEIGYINGTVEKKHESKDFVYVMQQQTKEVIKAKKNPNVRYVRIEESWIKD